MPYPAHLPFSQACENNQAPITAILQEAFAAAHHVLEIGSGTGQHSVYMAPRLPLLIWQTSDLLENHAGISAWHAAYPSPNLRLPLALDMRMPHWPVPTNAAEPAIDAVFTSNTLHIMAWPLVQQFFAMVGTHLPVQGTLVVYGPFNYGGQFTSDSNRAFNDWLHARDPHSAIRDFEAVNALTEQHGLHLQADHAMPANNRTLVWRKA